MKRALVFVALLGFVGCSSSDSPSNQTDSTEKSTESTAGQVTEKAPVSDEVIVHRLAPNDDSVHLQIVGEHADGEGHSDADHQHADHDMEHGAGSLVDRKKVEELRDRTLAGKGPLKAMLRAFGKATGLAPKGQAVEITVDSAPAAIEVEAAGVEGAEDPTAVDNDEEGAKGNKGSPRQ